MRKAYAAALAAAVLAGVAVATASGGGGGAGVVPAKALFGGGHIGVPGSSTFEAELQLTTVAPDKKDQTKLTFYGDWNAPCEGGGGQVAVFVLRNLRVAANGTFSGRGTVGGAAPGSTVTVQGRFGPPTTAAGTGRARFRFPGPNGQLRTCDTGNVSWQVRADTPLRGKPAWRANASYFGNSSQTLPVLARVTPDGKRIQVVVMPEFTCTSGVKFIPGANISPITTIRSGGTFRVTETFSSGLVGPGREGTGKTTATGTGRFGANALAGTWTFSLDITLKDGKKDTCQTGTVKWAARS